MAEIFERTTWLQTSVERAFAFHLDPANIRLIAPPSLKIVALEKPEMPQVGSVIRLTVRHWVWTQHWEVVWEVIEHPRGTPLRARLVDRARRSPFAAWCHEHAFNADGCGCWMTDRVTFQLPLAPWSRPALPLARWALERMFEERHRRTAAYFDAGTRFKP